MLINVITHLEDEELLLDDELELLELDEELLELLEEELELLELEPLLDELDEELLDEEVFVPCLHNAFPTSGCEGSTIVPQAIIGPIPAHAGACGLCGAYPHTGRL